MPKRKGKLPPLPATSLVMRQVDVSRPTRAVVATENPVRRYDEQTDQVVNEVLLMDGIEFRGGRDQMPIVDSHDDTTVRNILGSIQRLQVDHGSGELYGVPVFASDPDAQTIQARMQEGHITDFSITAQPLESLFVPKGQSYTTNRGAVIEGPAIIHTRWQPHNASICATGADEYSTVRRSYTDLNRKRIIRMNPELLAKLTAMGLPDGVTDPDQVLSWVIGYVGEDAMKESTDMVESAAEPLPTEVVAPVEKMDAPMTEEPVVEKSAPVAEVARSTAQATALIKRALDADQKRRNEIQATCKLAKVERSFADELCDAGVSVEVAKQKVIERMATQPIGSSVGADVRVTESADDKYFAAARDGLLMRAQTASRVKRSLFGEEAKPAAGSQDFRHVSLLRMAENFMRRAGVNTDKFSAPEIARAAIGDPKALARMRIQRSDPAYHTTGTFSNLLMDAANKTLLAGYEEAPYTWNLWARQAGSVDDFKNINRIRFSESPDLEHVPENSEYPEGVMSDSKESYKVEKFGKTFSVTWETVVNDDLDAISRIPAMHGNAARRTQNKKVYEVLTSNPTMGDTFPLFSASHPSGDNTSGASAAPSVTTLNAAFVKMMLQKGLNSDAILNIIPRYVIVPVALSATVLELFGSLSYAASNNNANVKNIYGPGGERPLTPIIEPQLDSSSATAWYMAADPSQIDTVEISFLSGEESPVLENEWDFDKDCYKYKIRQTFGVKAIDWRGLFRNA